MKDYTSVKRIILIFLIVIAIAVSSILGVIYYKKQEKESFEINESLNPDLIKKEKKAEPKEKGRNLVVDIKGEIKNPGIYKVDKNTRVIDVIEMAGGLTEKADTSVINLSKKIVDEMIIIVYSREEVIHFVTTKEREREKLAICNDGEVVNGACIKQDTTSDENNTMNGKININTARVEELQTLPGIGEAKAKNIINYREKNGNFTNIEGILEVEGIGNSIYDQIKNYITI